ncbi:uncharacterized protein [Montipora capricornis]|uniref:uncharacterized protein n=1 Tax=Montipora capricornis TaxID=246305 RepID=UPI0035F198F1
MVTVDSVATRLNKISASSAGGPTSVKSPPRIWKQANIPPVPKGTSIEDFNKDLRPISLTSTLFKVTEGFSIDKELEPVRLECTDPNKFGFIPNSWTTFALISMLQHWPEATDGTGSHVWAALLDYRKASDLVDHNLLVAKLYSLGVKPTVVNRVAGFLRERSQRGKLGSDCFSEFTPVPAGISLDTCIGPCLFLVMINDLTTTDNSLSAMWKFADDTTDSEVVPKFGRSNLQATVDHVLNWSNGNKVNSFRCKELRVSV